MQEGDFNKTQALSPPAAWGAGTWRGGKDDWGGIFLHLCDLFHPVSFMPPACEEQRLFHTTSVSPLPRVDFEKGSSKEDIRMAHKYVKRCSTLLISRKM